MPPTPQPLSAGRRAEGRGAGPAPGRSQALSGHEKCWCIVQFACIFTTLTVRQHAHNTHEQKSALKQAVRQ
eukprot:7214174-Alexandrium_andersonii.AAC.1